MSQLGTSRIENLEDTGREGTMTAMVEEQTSKLPSMFYLGLAVGAMAVSFALQLSGDVKKKEISNFIGQWAPSLLVIGLYNKLVKVHGH